jgi:acyl-CoA thioesterase-2
VDELVELLDLEELEVNIFRGSSPPEQRLRVFGGQVAAQALVAATRTVAEDRPVHSLHAYFLKPGDVAAPIVYFGDRIRDGRSFTTRRVVAIQHGVAIFNMSASFQVREEGLEHHLEMPDVPDPETLPTFVESMKQKYGDDLPKHMTRQRAIDIRYCEPATVEAGRPARASVWMRADGELPDDHRIHAAVLAYATDYTLTDTVMRPHGVHWLQPGVMTASLDHCVWFHRDARADQWWLYAQDSPTAGGGRGLARGSIFTRDKQLVCSVTQEIVLRTPGD